MKLKIINAQDKERIMEVPTDEQLEQFEMYHETGGNGWIMVENIDAEYCRVVSAGRGQISPQAYLAWKPRLKVAMQQILMNDGNWQTTNDPQPIRDDVKAAILKLRGDFKAGRKQVVSTWIK